MLSGDVKEELYEWPERLLTSDLTCDPPCAPREGCPSGEGDDDQLVEMTLRQDFTYRAGQCTYICGQCRPDPSLPPSPSVCLCAPQWGTADAEIKNRLGGS